jgi:hypothetical protein
MDSYFSIASDLEHDGDSLVRYQIHAVNPNFSGSTLAWGSADDVQVFAQALNGFPKSVPACEEVTFGSHGTGHCRLKLQTYDGLGHCSLWIEIEAEYPPRGSGKFETAAIYLEIDPVHLDEFCLQLRRFERGRKSEAILLCRAL